MVAATKRRAKAKRPAAGKGRPTKWKPEYVDQARKLAMLGLTNEQQAEVFGVAPGTFDRWLARRADFRGAVKEGRIFADATVAQSLFHRATGYSHPAVKIMQHEGEPVIVPFIERFPPDPTSCIFWLKNRQPQLWRDKLTVAHEGVDFAGIVKEARGRLALMASSDGAR